MKLNKRNRRNLGINKNSIKKQMSEINVTPFVDVMLVLLIVFMITAPLLTTGVKIDLPKANTPTLSGNDEPLIISINANTEVFLSERKTNLDELHNKLSAINKVNPEMRVFVRADKKVNYSVLMRVIEEITKSGLNRISLVTLPAT